MISNSIILLQLVFSVHANSLFVSVQEANDSLFGLSFLSSSCRSVLEEVWQVLLPLLLMKKFVGSFLVPSRLRSSLVRKLCLLSAYILHFAGDICIWIQGPSIR